MSTFYEWKDNVLRTQMIFDRGVIWKAKADKVTGTDGTGNRKFVFLKKLITINQSRK